MPFRHRPDQPEIQAQNPTLNIQPVDSGPNVSEGTVNPGQILGVFKRRWPLVLAATAAVVRVILYNGNRR
jgi:uncharacterized protein involved in exopolysaccharide biosynthesis